MASSHFLDMLLHAKVSSLTYHFRCFREKVPLSDFPLIRAKHFGPVLKLVLLICAPIIFVCWPVVGIVGSILSGAAYGLLSPIFSTFNSVGSGKSNQIFRCFYVCELDDL